ncbi:MAG TPA: LuxR C-terminal-related transcriptional regulator [Acidimicrobiales bacterium]|jgi:transcriptional regulator of acetoin/glycerol metabolism/DNA-binding CsgD family transcriptional regulator|nr:LuxR C-terminal-related transcriptional regulator [Acidimicrobiales bacterium]
MATDGSDLRHALEELLSAGSTGARLRPEIAASWQRSKSFDLHPDRFEVAFDSEPDPDDRLVRAARPVLDSLVEDLDSIKMSLVLSDRHGNILDRLVGDRPLLARLDRIMLAPGFRYDEGQVGTNAIGTALEQQAPSIVIGSEHFADALTQMACAASPIVDPATGSVVGAIDLTCAVDGSHSLMLSMAKRSAREIEQRLVSGNSAADRFLLACFLRARRGTRSAVVAINGQAMYTNAPAVKLLRGLDRVGLWELVSAALFDRPQAQLELPMPSGRSSVVACETIADGGNVIGALLRFLPDSARARDGDGSIPRRVRRDLGWESLTETERSIAELVAEGHTNREVAASMFLSPHTVGYHLRHIFQKVGVDSRVGLTRHLVQQGHPPA